MSPWLGHWLHTAFIGTPEVYGVVFRRRPWQRHRDSVGSWQQRDGIGVDVCGAVRRLAPDKPRYSLRWNSPSESLRCILCSFIALGSRGDP